jgi:glycosyltransferase involved in cell wall biosynthesis
MEDKIIKVLDLDKLKSDLIEKGRKRVKLFSWKDLGKKTLEVYKKCV